MVERYRFRQRTEFRLRWICTGENPQVDRRRRLETFTLVAE